MKPGVTAWSMATGGVSVAMLLAVSTALAEVDENPYDRIIARNVFGLKEPPPPPDPESVKPPPPNITLTGIVSLGGKRALMKTPPVAGKPGEAPKEQSYILREGERDGEIEVVSIDEINGVVKVKNGGKEVSLNFKDNGPKLPSGGPVATPMPGVPGIAAPVPAMGVPGAANVTIPGSLPQRTLRLPPAPGAVPQGGATGVPNVMPTPVPGLGTQVPVPYPGSGVSPGGVSVGNQVTHISSTTLDPEQQALAIEVMRQTGGGGALPITKLTPRQPADGQQGNAQPQPQTPPVPGMNRPPGF